VRILSILGCLPLVPVGPAPEVRDGVDLQLVAWKFDYQLGGDAVRIGSDVVDYPHLLLLQPVDAAHGGDMVEVERVLHECGHIEPGRLVHRGEHPVLGGLRDLHILRELLDQCLGDNLAGLAPRTQPLSLCQLSHLSLPGKSLSFPC
jgi:hypothetical protein